MLKVDNISFEYDHKEVLREITFTVNRGERIGLVGPNGAGKSTLLKLMAGLLEQTEGRTIPQGDVSIGYLPQELTSWNDLSAIDYLKTATGIAEAEVNMEKASDMADDSPSSIAKLQTAMDRLETLGAYTFDSRLNKAMKRVSLNEAILKQKVRTLSGGQKTRLSLIAILLSKYDLLLLDEPTNNLDLEGLDILESYLMGSKRAFVIVSHDRRFLRKIATKIIELTPGQEGVDIYSLGYDEFVQSRAAKRLALEQSHKEYLEEKDRLQEAAERKQIAARRAASNKSRSDSEKVGKNSAQEKAVGAHASAAKSLQARLEQLKEPPRPSKELDLNFRFRESEAKMNGRVAEISGAAISFGDTNIGPFDLRVHGGDKIVITGPNGSGKTTLLKLIAGLLKPARGTIQLGRFVKLGLVDQDQTLPLPDESLIANAKSLINKSGIELLDEGEIRQVLARFNLGKESIMQKARELSPGERSRVLLATLIARGTNVLLLDEPTNHLDIDATEELERAIAKYEGTYLIISHDRDFIDAIHPNKTFEMKAGRIV